MLLGFITEFNSVSFANPSFTLICKPTEHTPLEQEEPAGCGRKTPSRHRLSTPRGITEAHMMRNGLIKRIDGRDSLGRAKFVENFFGVAA